MPDNKTQITSVDVDSYLSTIDKKRRLEASILIDMMK